MRRRQHAMQNGRGLPSISASLPGRGQFSLVKCMLINSIPHLNKAYGYIIYDYSFSICYQNIWTLIAIIRYGLFQF